MSATISLATITKTSFRIVRETRLLWWFVLPAGALIALSTYVGEHLPVFDADKTATLSDWVVRLNDPRLLSTFALLFLATLSQAAIRGPLMRTVNHAAHSKEVDTVASVEPSWRDWLRALSAAVIVEGTYWLLLLSIALVFALPCSLAWHFNRAAFPIIADLGILVLITLGVYLYFIKELSLYYAVLGRARIAPAIDLGFRLFRKQTFNTLLFFSYLLLLALIFALTIEALMHPLQQALETTPALRAFLPALFFGGYYVFDQTLRTIFFRTIASTPRAVPEKKVAVLEPSESQSGSPLG